MGRYRPKHLAREPRRARRAVARSVGATVVLVIAGAALVAASAATVGSGDVEAVGEATSARATTATSTSTSTTAAPPPRTGTLAFSGDVLAHTGVWKAADTGDGYDFSPLLAPIAPQLTAAGAAICHLEVTLGRPGDRWTGYPRFRAPPELAAALAGAGFDGCSVASNHALDYGEPGVTATLDAMDAAGLKHVGTARSSAEDQEPARYLVDGISVAQLSYAYGFNGFTEPADKSYLVDQIDPAAILADARAARAGGAEFVVVSLHWGQEYRHEISPAQQAVADALAAEPGVIDLVVGTHAHVVQPISRVGQLWVVWGMGNMVSNNSPRCCLADATDGVVVTVTIGDTPGGGVGVQGVAFTPTWNERAGFRVLPIATTLEAGVTDPRLAADLRASFQRTTGHVLALAGAEFGVVPDHSMP